MKNDGSSNSALSNIPVPHDRQQLAMIADLQGRTRSLLGENEVLKVRADAMETRLHEKEEELANARVPGTLANSILCAPVIYAHQSHLTPFTHHFSW